MQICPIEDCYLIAFNGNEKWYNNINHDSEVSFAYDSENSLHNTSLKAGFFEKSFTPTGNWEMTFDCKGTTKYNAGARWGIKCTSNASPERCSCAVEIENYNTYIDFANSNTNVSKQNMNAISNYTHFKFEAIGNTLNVYRDNTLIRTITTDWLNGELTLFIQQWVNYIDFYWKNIKIKAL